jgi:hypothetical protein
MAVRPCLCVGLAEYREPSRSCRADDLQSQQSMPLAIRLRGFFHVQTFVTSKSGRYDINEKITSRNDLASKGVFPSGLATAFAIEPFVKVRFAIADEMIE